MTVVHHPRRLAVVSRVQMMALTAAFDCIDENGDGVVDFSEWVQVRHGCYDCGVAAVTAPLTPPHPP